MHVSFSYMWIHECGATVGIGVWVVRLQWNAAGVAKIQNEWSKLKQLTFSVIQFSCFALIFMSLFPTTTNALMCYFFQIKHIEKIFSPKLNGTTIFSIKASINMLCYISETLNLIFTKVKIKVTKALYFIFKIKPALRYFGFKYIEKRSIRNFQQ